MKKKDSDLIFEKNFRTTWLQRIGRILCLFIPIGAAFGGYFASPLLWALLSEKAETPEFFKFLMSIVLFALAVLIIFFKTRNTNPIMKIRVLNKNQDVKAN